MEKNNKPLSILQIASGFPAWGGTELHLLNLSNQLTLRGHNVTVACRPGGWVANRAIEMGLKTVDITVLRQWDWTDYGKLRDWCKQNKIDIMHCHWSTDAMVPAAAARAAGVPVRLMTRHSPYPFKSALGRWIFTKVLYNRILGVSQSVVNTLIKCGISKDKLTVIHHGTDVGEFEQLTLDRETVRETLGLIPSDVAVGIVGRIAEEKGHRYLYDALAKIDPGLGVKVVVVGDGPESESGRAYVETNGLNDRVIFCPFRKDVNNVFNALDIIAVPSIWEEPCSAVIQQGMALSRPVIGTLAGGTPEMILDGVTGLLVPTCDAGSLAAAIGKLARDPELRDRMGVAGHARVEAHFSLQVMTDKNEALYRRELDLVRGSGVS